VRIMTVYKAKGLEFPVVILIDPTCPHTFQEPSRYVDGARGLWAMPLAGCTPVELSEHRAEVLAHDREEAVRLTYVAATRARELLVVPVVGDQVVPGWVDVLHPVVYPKPSERRAARPAPACPSFGSDSVLERPGGMGADQGVQPGLHAPQAGAHAVVWWDPKALGLDKKAEAGLRQQRILAADEKGVTAEESERAHAGWESRRKDLLERGATPSLRIQTFTEAKATPGAAEDGVRIDATHAVGKSRPGGPRFGTLVHGILEVIHLDAGRHEVEEASRTLARGLGASTEESHAAAEAVIAALEHPIILSARAAGTACRREAPISLRTEDGSVIEGVLDLAFRVTDKRGASWVVVDYKTDAQLEGKQAQYETQVRLYARAVAAATGEPARGVLLRV
jgi:ATP-dependent helicase/nuclease subunit A